MEVVKLTVQTCSAGGIEPPLQTADLKTLSIKERLNYTIIAKIVKSSSFFVELLTGAMFVTIFLAHGFSKKTAVAVISTAISLTLTGVFALIFVKFWS